MEETHTFIMQTLILSWTWALFGSTFSIMIYILNYSKFYYKFYYKNYYKLLLYIFELLLKYYIELS